MANEKVTQLPNVLSSTLADIIYAVQGGVSVQETLGQVQQLMLGSTVLNYNGNPNSHIAGTTYQLCWDTTNGELYVCTTTGSASTAMWTLVGAKFSWITVNSTSSPMVSNQGYITNNVSLVTLTLPTSSNVGDEIAVSGQASGGWSIVQGSSQQINIGSRSTTLGVGGSVSSFNQFDSLNLVCIVANTIWTTSGAPQGNLTIV